MRHDDSKLLKRLGNRVEVLLMQEMSVAGLDALTADDAKNDCACSVMERFELESMDAMSNGNSWSDMRRRERH